MSSIISASKCNNRRKIRKSLQRKMTIFSVLLLLIITAALLFSCQTTATVKAANNDYNMTKVSNITTFFNEASYNGAIIDQLNNKGYFATFTVPGIIVRVNLQTMAREAAIRMSKINPNIGYFGSGIEICGKAYFPCQTSPRGAFVEVDMNRFDVTAIRYGEAGEFEFTSPVSFLDFIVFGTQSSPAYLIEFNLATLDRTLRNMTLPADNVRASVSKGRIAFFVVGIIGGSISKIDLHTMTQLEFFFDPTMSMLNTVCGGFDPKFGAIYNELDSYFVSTSTSSSSTTEIASALQLSEKQTQLQESFLYLGTGQQLSGSFYKIRVTENITRVLVETLNKRNNASYSYSYLSMTVADRITKGTSIRYVVDCFLVRDIVFFLQTSSTGVLYRLNATNFSSPVAFDTLTAADYTNRTISYVDNISGSSGQDFNVMVTDGRFVYVGTNSNPGEIIKYETGIRDAMSTTHSVNYSSSVSSIGTLFDSFGVSSVDINSTFSCSDRGTYIGKGFSARFSPVTAGLVEVRIFNSSVWGVISNDLMNAETAAGLCNMLGYPGVTWATYFTYGSTPFNNTVRNATTTTSSAVSSSSAVSLRDLITSSSSFIANSSFALSEYSSTISSLNSTRTSSLSPNVYPELLSEVKHPFDAPIFFDDLVCPRDARYIDNCTFKVYFLNDAAPSESLGLRCEAQNEALQSGGEKNESDIVISGGWKFKLARNGRVDVKPVNAEIVTTNTGDDNTSTTTSSSFQNPRTWGTLCNKGMSRFTPAALCRILGYPQGVGYLTHFQDMETLFEDIITENISGTTNVSDLVATTPIYLSHIYCPQTMNAGGFSTECRYEKYNYSISNIQSEALDETKLHGYNPESARFCNHSHSVGLICSGSVDEGVYVGQRLFLRLNQDSEDLNGTSNNNNNKNRVETRKLVGIDRTTGANIYSEWKSVCKNKAFRMRDALALCRMLGYVPRSYVGIHSINRATLRENLSGSKRGISKLICLDENAKNLGYCSFIQHFDDEQEQYCGDDDGDTEFGLVCDAEEKGVRGGDFYWRQTIDAPPSSSSSGKKYLQARPAPQFYLNFNTPTNKTAVIYGFDQNVTNVSYIENVTSTVVNAFPVVEAFGAVVVEGEAVQQNDGGNNNRRSSFYVNLLYNLTFSTVGQNEVDSICVALGFPPRGNGGANHEFAVLDSSSAANRLNLSNPAIDTAFWSVPSNYDQNTNLDKIALQNLSCNNNNNNLSECSYNVFGGPIVDFAAAANVLNDTTLRSGGSYGTVVTIKCDRGGDYSESNVVALAMLIFAAFAVVAVALLIVFLLVKCGVLAGAAHDSDDDEDHTQQQKTADQLKKSQKQRPPPPPTPSSTADSEDGDYIHTSRGPHLISPAPPGELLRVEEDTSSSSSGDEEEEEVIVSTSLGNHLSPEYQRRLDPRYGEVKYKGGVLGTRHRYLAGYDDNSNNNNRNNNSNSLRMDPSQLRQQQTSGSLVQSSQPSSSTYPTFEQLSVSRGNRGPPRNLPSPSVVDVEDDNGSPSPQQQRHHQQYYSQPYSNSRTQQQLPPLGPSSARRNNNSTVISPSFPAR